MARRRTTDRGTQGYRQRQVEVREQNPRFLIVCEGEKTEPNYFRGLAQDHRLNARVTVMGKGLDPSQLVETTQTERRLGDYDHDDRVWCVFDRDSWTAENFNSALAQARQHKILVAYSNEAFELWYLLHFHYYHTGITRRQYITKLEKELGHPYAKNSRDIYRELRSRHEDALRNARTLLAQYDPADPANDNPSTTVHLLVEELLHHAR
jgi:hypothetical protein